MPTETTIKPAKTTQEKAHDRLTYKKLIQRFFDVTGQKLSKQEQEHFLHVAYINKVDPFKKEIYPVPMRNSDLKKNLVTPIIDYLIFVRKAEDGGDVDGWKTEIYKDQGKVTGGKITIYRKSRSQPFEYEVDFNEIVQTKKDGEPNSVWTKTPGFMTKKTLIRQGFKMCFPGSVKEDFVINEENIDQSTIEVQEADVVETKELDDKELEKISSKYTNFGTFEELEILLRNHYTVSDKMVAKAREGWEAANVVNAESK